MGYKRYIRVEPEDLEAAHAIRFRGEDLADELPLTVRMNDGSEVQGQWYERRQDVTRDQGDRWDGIELEVDDPRGGPARGGTGRLRALSCRNRDPRPRGVRARGHDSAMTPSSTRLLHHPEAP